MLVFDFWESQPLAIDVRQCPNDLALPNICDKSCQIFVTMGQIFVKNYKTTPTLHILSFSANIWH